MVSILFALASIFVFRFRSRAALELKRVALEHQLAVLRRQHRGRSQLSSLDRLLWVLLYRVWPKVIDTMVLVKPATVIGWHRSRRPGRPRISPAPAHSRSPRVMTTREASATTSAEAAGMTHLEAEAHAADTKLPIREGARQLLRVIAGRELPGRGR